MALAISIGGVNQLAYLQPNAVLRFNTFDGRLINPATIPALGDAVVLSDPTWNGTITSVTRTPTPLGGDVYVTFAATNTDEAAASAAPHGLSDSPNYSTTFGYKDLSVTTVDNLDGSSETQGTLVMYEEGIWPAMTFQLTNSDLGYSAQDFTAQDVTVTWVKGTPIYSMQFGDPIVTTSVWVASQAGNAPDGSISGTKITDGSVTTPKVAANAITAEKLAASLILASIIKTAEDGNRVEISPDGIELYDSADELEVRIPTDGSGVYVKGDIAAGNLSIADGSITGDLHARVGSHIYADAAIEAPSTPYAYSTLKSTMQLENTDYEPMRGTGMGYYDAAGGASGSTACYVGLGWDQDTGTVFVYEWDLSDGSLDRTTTLGTITFGEGAFITRIGSYWYVTGQKKSDGLEYLFKFARSDGSYVAEADFSSYTTGTYNVGLPIGNDGTYVYLLGRTSTNNFRVIKYNTSLAYQSVTELTDPTVTAGYEFLYGGNAQGFTVANIGSGTRFWVQYSEYKWSAPAGYGSNYIYEFQTDGTRVSNTEFPHGGRSNNPLMWDGTQFTTVSSAMTYRLFSNWTWTTESPVYWIGQAWYDSVGTTHETDISARISVTHVRRWFVRVINVSVPTGGVDDPDKVRTYAYRGASDPGATNFWLQVEDAVQSRYLDSYTGSGTNDGGGTAFPDGTPSYMANRTSTYGDWELDGDGYFALTHKDGSVKGAISNDPYYTDGGILHEYLQRFIANSSSLRAITVDNYSSSSLVDGEEAFVITGMGNLEWGPSDDARDLRLRRTAASEMTIDDGASGAADVVVSGGLDVTAARPVMCKYTWTGTITSASATLALTTSAGQANIAAPWSGWCAGAAIRVFSARTGGTAKGHFKKNNVAYYSALEPTIDATNTVRDYATTDKATADAVFNAGDFLQCEVVTSSFGPTSNLVEVDLYLVFDAVG